MIGRRLHAAALCGSLLQVITKERHRAHFRSGVGEAVELSLLCEQARGAHECAPGRARERTADAHPRTPSEAISVIVSSLGRPDEQIDRLRCYGGHHRGDLFGVRMPGA